MASTLYKEFDMWVSDLSTLTTVGVAEMFFYHAEPLHLISAFTNDYGRVQNDPLLVLDRLLVSMYTHIPDKSLPTVYVHARRACEESIMAQGWICGDVLDNVQDSRGTPLNEGPFTYSRRGFSDSFNLMNALSESPVNALLQTGAVVLPDVVKLTYFVLKTDGNSTRKVPVCRVRI